MPDRPIPKPKQFLKVLDILNTQDAANMIDPKSYADMVGQYAFKAYKNDELSYRDYLGIVKPLFGKAGEMVTKKIEERDKYLERYATGGRVKYSDGSDEPDISKLREKIIELMDNDNLTFEEAYREAREEGYAAGGRVNFNAGGSDPKTGQGFQKGNTGFRTKDGEVRNVTGKNQFTTKTPKEIRSIINDPKYSDYTPYRFRNEGILSRTETDKIAPENNIKFKRTGPLPADTEKQKTQKAIKFKKRVGAIRKQGGLPYSYSGTKAYPKGHASNIYGKNIITPSEIIYTPEKINLAMSGKKGVDTTIPMQALDFKIKDTEQKIQNIKKSNMPAAKKKIELAKLDDKLVEYVGKSRGYKVATLSNNTKYGKTFQSLKSLDMFDEFEGMSEKEMNNFIKKYKNMKVNKNTTKTDFNNIVKAKIAAENIKNAKKNAARGGGGTQMFDAFKPSGLSPFRKLKMLSSGGPVKYGKYAKQIISS